MDYQGNYFPEEQDENESKVYRTVKGIFKWSMYGISFVIYAIIIYLMITNRDSKILEQNYMLDDIDTEDIILYRLNTKIFMNDDGSLQIYNADYSPEHSLVEIGVKFNAKKLTDNDYGDCLDYVLTDSEGKTYKMINMINDGGGRYGFARICFEDISIDLDSNDLRYNIALDAAALPVISSKEDKFDRTEIYYDLSVYRKSDGELLYKFRLYDNSVTFNKTDYND